MSKNLSYIELSKGALQNNVQQFKKLLPKEARLVAVVKANAYGHGVKEVVSLLKGRVDYFQVDDIEELREIREYTKAPVLVFGYIRKIDLKEAVELGGILGVYDKDIFEELNKIGRNKNKKITVHLKVDALLGRQGILLEEVREYRDFIKKLPFINLGAVYSHFSNIEDSKHLTHAKKQWKQLMEVKKFLQLSGFPKIIHHISATSGLLTDLKMNWGGSLVRLGIGLYGQWPSEHLKNSFSNKVNLKPVMRWVSHLAQIKTIPSGYPVGYGLTFISKKIMTIGIVPQGYSDGYDRGFSNNSFVLVGGKKCKVIGRVAMNMFAVNVSNIKGVKNGDEVILLGKQGREEVTADLLANSIETINYEIVTRVSSKLPRVVVM